MAVKGMLKDIKEMKQLRMDLADGKINDDKYIESIDNGNDSAGRKNTGPSSVGPFSKPRMHLYLLFLLAAAMLIIGGTFLQWIHFAENVMIFPPDALTTIKATGWDLAHGQMEYSLVAMPKMTDIYQYPEIYLLPIIGMLVLVLPLLRFPILNIAAGGMAALIPLETIARLEPYHVGSLGGMTIHLGFDEMAAGAYFVVSGGILAIIIGWLMHREMNK